jgi:hypothetical protein
VEVNGQLHAPALLLLELDEPQGRSTRAGKDAGYCPCRVSNRGHQVISLVKIVIDWQNYLLIFSKTLYEM